MRDVCTPAVFEIHCPYQRRWEGERLWGGFLSEQEMSFLCNSLWFIPPPLTKKWGMTIRAGHGSRNQRAEIPLGRVRPVWVCSQQTGSRCRGLRCHRLLLPQPHNRLFLPGRQQIASQSLNLHARKHDRRLSRWELGTEAPTPNKRTPACRPHRAKGCKVSFLCMLWFI